MPPLIQDLSITGFRRPRGATFYRNPGRLWFHSVSACRWFRVPVAEHCDRYKPTIEERLKLFVAVCEAAQYACQRAIIHRDVKPSNVLVAYARNRWSQCDEKMPERCVFSRLACLGAFAAGFLAV